MEKVHPLTDLEQNDSVWMNAAWLARECSHDPHHRVGCVAVAIDGRHVVSANRIPSKLNHNVAERLVYPGKSTWLVHGEVMCVCGAARCGISLAMSTVYTTRFPCDGCALILIAAGVGTVVSPAPDFMHHRWGLSFIAADAKFREAQVLTRRPFLPFNSCIHGLETLSMGEHG